MLLTDISPEDFEQILIALPSLYLLQDLTELPRTMMRIADALIPNLFCTYNELHPATQNVVVAYHPEPWRARMEPLIGEASRHLDDHPVYTHVQSTGDGAPCAISDFLAEEKWRASGFASAIMQPLGIRDTMIFCLVAANSAMIFIAFNRDTWGFSARDKQVANLLRSHFVAAYNNAVAFTQSQALALVANSSASSVVGIVAVDGSGQVVHANEEAIRLVRKYFDLAVWRGALPAAIQNWLSHDAAVGLPASVLEEVSGSHRLLIRWGRQENESKILLMQEQTVDETVTPPPANLSRRESEVLTWLVEGKTNSEIGRILAISVRTVEKHVEMIYRKLGVETRTGAILRILSKDLPSPTT